MMKLNIYFLFILPFLFQLELKGKVIGVSDGDTITILVDSTPIKIRLNGIDCPEKNQAFGDKAKEFTSKMCFGQIVKVNQFGQDRYGRTLGDIVLPNMQILNAELVKAGLAWHYKKYSNDQALAEYENEARKLKKGLWVDHNAIAPWDFRMINRN